MMKRAMGGLQGFDAMSPTVLLKLAAAAISAASGLIPPSSASLPPAVEEASPAHGYFSKFDLSGEAIPFRAGLADASTDNDNAPTNPDVPPALVARLSDIALADWPPTYVM